MTDIPKTITVEELNERRQKGENPTVLDVRNPDELEIASIEDTLKIPMPEIPDRVNELAEHKDQELIVMCHHGGRSQRVCNFLEDQGFEKVRNLTGGIHHWSTKIDSDVPTYE